MAQGLSEMLRQSVRDETDKRSTVEVVCRRLFPLRYSLGSLLASCAFFLSCLVINNPQVSDSPIGESNSIYRADVQPVLHHKRGAS